MQSAFFAPGGFMQNFNSVSGPRPTDDGTYAITNIVSPTTRVPLIDTVGDTGKYVGAILASPEKYAGKVFSAATALYTYTEVCEIMSKVTGKNVVYKQLPKEVWGTFMPPGMAPSMVDMFVWVEEYGYFGPGTKEKVEWTVAQARGKLTGLEEYLRRCPLDLK